MTTTLSRQTSASDLNSNYRGTADSEIPPSPKSPTFAKSLHSRKASFQISAWLGRGTGQGPQSPSTRPNSHFASRPSRLATYLQALVPIAGTKEASSDDTFSSLFAAHLAQAGIVPQLQSSHNGPIHIFIDRPSAPYAHILTYLRSSGSSPSTLPRAASLALSAEPIRVEALCELRDEAKFLELTELVELCDKELRSRAPKLRSTASSSSLREYKFGSGSDASGARNSGPEATDSRLRDYRFGVPVESLQEEEGEGEHAVEVPPVVYEKRGSHAGMVTTVPPRNVQTVNSQIGTRILRSPPSQPRMRTISEVRYTTSGDGKTWI
ncbi:hypothetical protein RSAG8_03652, partial [Rhizoctonia solani AG-8 WAC10335]